MLQRTATILAIIFLSFGFSVDTHAQPQFAIDSDTLFYGNRPGAQNMVHVWNTGSEALHIDSLHFVTDRYSHGWSVGLTPSAQDTVIELRYAFGLIEYGVHPEITLAANDSLTIELVGFDGCLICGGKKGGYGDSLFVYSNDPGAQPHVVTVDFTYYVSTEEERELGSSVISVYPNPSQRDVSVEIDAEETGQHALKIYNVLGQQVWAQNEYLVTGQIWQVKWPGYGHRMAKGSYLLTVAVNNRITKKAFVLR